MKCIATLIISLLLAPIVLAESCVWKLDEKGAQVYLVGSVHVLRKTDYPLPPEFELAYKNSSRLLFETDMNEVAKPEMQSLLLSKAMLTDGKTLKTVLSKKTYAKLEAFSKARQIPVQTFDTLKPWFLAISLTMIELQKHGITPGDGIDYYFNKRATKDQKEIAGLEPPKDHIELLSTLENETSDDIIEQSLEEIEKLPGVINDLLKAWRAGDEMALDEFLSGTLKKDYPRIYKKLLIDRNKRWIPTIEKEIKPDNKSMIIVGCGHLVGKDSVIDLLRKKGYKLTKIKAPKQ